MPIRRLVQTGRRTGTFIKSHNGRNPRNYGYRVTRDALGGPPFLRPRAPFVELVRLSDKSVADELNEEHTRWALGE